MRPSSIPPTPPGVAARTPPTDRHGARRGRVLPRPRHAPPHPRTRRRARAAGRRARPPTRRAPNQGVQPPRVHALVRLRHTRARAPHDPLPPSRRPRHRRHRTRTRAPARQRRTHRRVQDGRLTPTQAVTVELLYFEGCPNRQALLPHLQEVIGCRAGADTRRRRGAARRHRFLGSPTVRADGRDGLQRKADDRRRLP